MKLWEGSWLIQRATSVLTDLQTVGYHSLAPARLLEPAVNTKPIKAAGTEKKKNRRKAAACTAREHIEGGQCVSPITGGVEWPGSKVQTMSSYLFALVSLSWAQVNAESGKRLAGEMHCRHLLFQSLDAELQLRQCLKDRVPLARLHLYHQQTLTTHYLNSEGYH